MQLQKAPKEKNRVICIIGMDGSGKTTHSRRLVDYLRESGIKCKYIWFGTASFLSYPFMIICRMLGFTRIHNLPNGLAIPEHQYYRNRPISSIWPWIQFLDAFTLVNLRVKVPLWRGFTIVCDRFVPDILVDLMTDVNDNRLYEKLIGRLMLRLTPRHSLFVSLRVSEKTAWTRKDDIPGLMYLSRRKEGYHLLTNHLRTQVIDTEESIFSVQQRLTSLVDKSLTQTSAL